MARSSRLESGFQDGLIQRLKNMFPGCMVFKKMCIRDRFYIIGKNDRDLMMQLRNAGTDHRKFMRMITCLLYTSRCV